MSLKTRRVTFSCRINCLLKHCCSIWHWKYLSFFLSRWCVHPGVQPGQQGLLSGGAAPEAADLRDQILPEKQNQGERGRPAGHLRQQVRQGLLSGGTRGRDRAASRRRQTLRVLWDLGKEEHQRGPDVSYFVHHGQVAQRNESGSALQSFPAPQWVAPQQILQKQEMQRWERVRGRGALRAEAQRAQWLDVHKGEGCRGQPDQREGLHHLLTCSSTGAQRTFADLGTKSIHSAHTDTPPRFSRGAAWLTGGDAGDDPTMLKNLPVGFLRAALTAKFTLSYFCDGTFGALWTNFIQIVFIMSIRQHFS